MKMTLPIFAFAALATACATSPTEPNSTTTSDQTGATERAIQQSQDGFSEAAMTPLEDVNIIRDEIPEPFKAIRNPYKVDAGMSCDAIAAEVSVLDGELGRDWDIPPPDKKGLSDRAADGASTAFLDTVASSAGGLIPFRGVVRTVSGANSHATKVRKAYERASHRRTFLKAIGMMKGCDYPAAPLPIPDEVPKVVFR